MTRGTQWTLDVVRSRCKVDGDCWIWQGGLFSTGYPYASIYGQKQHVRGFVFYKLMGRQKDRRLRVVSACGDRRCCSPQCLMGRTASTVISLQHREGTRRNNIRTPGETHPLAKLTQAQVDELRSLPQPFNAAEEARRLGVAPDTVRRILRGQGWKRQPARSVFEYRP